MPDRCLRAERRSLRHRLWRYFPVGRAGPSAQQGVLCRFLIEWAERTPMALTAPGEPSFHALSSLRPCRRLFKGRDFVRNATDGLLRPCPRHGTIAMPGIIQRLTAEKSRECIARWIKKGDERPKVPDYPACGPLPQRKIDAGNGLTPCTPWISKKLSIAFIRCSIALPSAWPAMKRMPAT